MRLPQPHLWPHACALAIVLFGAVTSVSAQPATLNLSHDLVPLGIASQNVAPDTPSLDARPLFYAGMWYAQSHGMTRVTVDPGAYYFLTEQYPGAYLELHEMHDLVFDLAGSIIYFRSPYTLGIHLWNCRRVTLSNFRVDFLEIPYTHVRLTSVDAVTHRLHFETLPGWVDPTTFHGGDLWAIGFRNGGIVPGTTNVRVADPISPGALQMTEPDYPYPQATLAALRPGDTVVVTKRAYGTPISSFGGDSILFSNLTVYGSSNWAVLMDTTSNGVADNIRVMPRPVTGLIGSNGDGIHFFHARQNSHIRNCYVARTLDDGIVIDSVWMGTLLGQPGSRQVRVQRYAWYTFPNGTNINFVDPLTAREIQGGHIVAQTPAYGGAAVFNGESVFTLDRDLPSVPAGSSLVLADPDARGAGSTIEDNTVEDTLWGRGIWISGSQGVAIRRNHVQRTGQGGIVVQQHMGGLEVNGVFLSYPGPPARDLVIEDNVVADSAWTIAPGAGPNSAIGGIVVNSTTSDHFMLSTEAVNTNITIRNNLITDAGFAAIWVSELAGGVIEGNQIVRPNRRQLVPFWGIYPPELPIYEANYNKPVVVHFSSNVTGGATHAPSQYLAEGATGSFFDTRLALFNPSASDPAIVNLTFQREGAANIAYSLALSPHGRRTIDASGVRGLESASFSTAIDSSTPIVVDRTMSWDHSGYGSHAETALPAPSTTWYFAEGSTSGDFALFYLLQNPNAAPVTATVRYLRPFGLPPIDRVYALPPGSRTTLPIDGQGPELASTDVSAVITATAPIIAERAMYKSTAAQTFAAGHESAGVTAPATHWFLAEGATGPFFDMFILLANPAATAAEVRVDYLLSTGVTHTKSYTVPANGRYTIFVDEEQTPAGGASRPLLNVAVSSTITSTNGVPIIVERTMWWPSPELTATFWTEAHNSPGATTTGTRWALAEGEVGGPQTAETYILLANTSPFAGQARVTLYAEDGAIGERLVPLAPNSRSTLNVSQDLPALVGKRFGALIESLGPTAAQIVVERAMYTSPNGQIWAAGTNALAARLAP